MKEVYQVLSGMIGQETRIAQIANNLANVNTTGFKKQSIAFVDYLKLAERPGEGAAVLNAASFTENYAPSAWPMLGGAYTDWRMGSLQTTGKSLDMAIEGEGFFQVEGPDGAAQFTRAGAFTLDGRGQLVTVDGKPVLSANGRPISLNLRGGAPQVANDGTIRQDNAVAGKVAVMRFDDPQQLVPAGAGVMAAPEGVEPKAVADPAVRSGVLEGSNVNPISEMTDMIAAQRSYEVNARVIQSLDDITRKRIDAAMP